MNPESYRHMYVSRSEVFAWYNRAKVAGRREALSLPRLNRALGILLATNRQDRLTSYSTTTLRCGCPDRSKNPHTACKHMLALWVIKRIVDSRTAANLANLVLDLSHRRQWYAGETVWLNDDLWLHNYGDIIYLCRRDAQVPIILLSVSPIDDRIAWMPYTDICKRTEIFLGVSNV